MPRPTLFTIALALCTCLAGCHRPAGMNSGPPAHVIRGVTILNTQAQAASDTRKWAVTHGEKDGQLVFAIFLGAKPVEMKLGDVGLIDAAIYETHVNLRKPEGGTMALPTKYQLVEIVDEKFAESEEPVALADFQAFMQSKPDAFTIANLLEFAKARRAPKG